MAGLIKTVCTNKNNIFSILTDNSFYAPASFMYLTFNKNLISRFQVKEKKKRKKMYHNLR